MLQRETSSPRGAMLRHNAEEGWPSTRFVTG